MKPSPGRWARRRTKGGTEAKGRARGALLAGLGSALTWAAGVEAGNAVDVAVGDLSSGQSVTVEIVVMVVDPTAAGVDLLASQGAVSGDNFSAVLTDDPDAGGAADPTTTDLEAQPDLRIEKSYGGSTPLPGDTVTFGLSFSNEGNQGATGVAVLETVPVGTIFDAGASTLGWSCVDGSPSGTGCELAMGSLAGGGAGGSVAFAVALEDPLPPGTASIVNTASIADDGGNGPDPNPSDNSAMETVLLDIESPTVLAIDTSASTPDGELTECETATVPVDRLLVAFSEPMRDPPGDGDPDDVTHAANYLLVSVGPNLEYDTVACGGAAGDDLPLAISDVTYDTPNHVATLHLGGRLGPGLHRLLVCGSTTLRDATGNALDGDGDGNGGDDFVLSFRTDPRNRFANGHLDCSTAGWMPVATGGAVQGFDPLTDGDGSPESGSATASLATPSATFAQATLGQCVRIPGGLIDVAARARLDVGPPISLVGLRFACEYYPSLDCTGGPLGAESRATGLGGMGGAFVAVGAELTAPAGTGSGLCAATWQFPAGSIADTWLDALSLRSKIFADGFESGDTSAWSVTVP
jgi:uncharacterized repeat protein (TIGR01451 family)